MRIEIDKEEIIQYMQENPRATITELSQNFGISAQAMSYKLKSMRLKWMELRNKYRKEQLEEIIRQNPRITTREISEKIGVSMTVVENDIKKYHLKTKKYKRDTILKKEDIEEFLKDNPNATIEEMAKHFNIHFQTMIRSLRRNDLKTLRARKVNLKQVGEKNLREYIKRNPKASLTKMSKDYGVTYLTLIKYLNEYNIELPGKRKKGRTPTKKEMEDYIKLHPGTTKTQMSEALDVSQSTIRKYIEIYNLKLNRKNRKKRKNNKYNNLTREELLSRIIQILKSVQDAPVTTLKKFFEQKGIEISEEELSMYRKGLLEEREKDNSDEGR